MLYRCLDVVEGMREEGINIGLINKPTLNVVDQEMLSVAGNSPFVLVVESQSTKSGLGLRYGTWLLENGFAPKYAHLGTSKEGRGGLGEQVVHQGCDPAGIKAKLSELLKR